ncbi:MAG: hypothetical protein GY870_11200 [archaeon]|nr:hypothetical protein [archaeon]
MTALTYTVGVIFALLSGSLSNLGNVIEKKAIMEIPKEKRDDKFARRLFKNPLWLFGFIMAMIIDPIFLMFANFFMGEEGGFLVPGIFAGGLVVLAIGSAVLLKEKLGKIEIFGIFLMIIGVTSVTISSIDHDSDGYDFTDSGMILRIIIFTFIILLGWIVTYLMSRREKNDSKKGIIVAISSGCALGLSNYWINIITAVIGGVFSGTTPILSVEFMLFLAASILLPLTNFFGIGQIQIAFKYADASKAIPIQYTTLESIPLGVFYFIHLGTSEITQTLLITIGVICIITSGFLLARIQAAMEADDIPLENQIELEQNSQTKICPLCGAKNSIDAAFCFDCNAVEGLQ